MRWLNMILLHFHDCILIVDNDYVLVKVNQNPFQLLMFNAFICNTGGQRCQYHGLSPPHQPWLANEMGWRWRMYKLLVK